MSTTTIPDPWPDANTDAGLRVQKRLSKKHLNDLIASGLTAMTIEAAEFYTLKKVADINKILRRKDGGTLGACLVIPYFDLDGNRVPDYERVKPDNPPLDQKKDKKPAKYLSPKGVHTRPYFPRGAGVAIRDGGRPLVFTEGEKKALAVWQLGVPVIGLGGVEMWSRPRAKGKDGKPQGERKLHPELAGLPWRGRTVYVVFDSDVIHNRRVLGAEAALAHALRDLGAVVKLVRIPPPKGEGKLGIDDYLKDQANPAAALQALFDRATDFEESIRRMAAGPYRVEEGRIVHDKFTKDGVVVTPLCNFVARIVTDIARDDGSGEVELTFGIEGELAAGRPLRRVAIPADRFAGMAWPAEAWGSRAIVAAGFGSKDRLREAIQQLSDPIRQTVYTHLGWREIDGQWYYLHAGGAIGADSAVSGICCDPPRPLRLFVLPDPPAGEELKRAVRSSLKLLDGRIRDRVSFPAAAAAYRAPLGQVDFAGFLAGPTGLFKSELAALAQQHYGPGLDARHLPGNWSSTANALEGIAFAAKDALLVVDDFAPGGSGFDVQRAHREAARLLRGQGNNAGRQRMAADTSHRPEKPPRGLILGTGEDVPQGESIRARLGIIEVGPGDIPAAALTEFQQAAAAGEYARATAGYLRHLAADYGAVRVRLAAERAALRAEFAAAGQHARTPGVFADLALGLKYFLAFAVSCEAVTPAERGDLWRRGRAAFAGLAGEQADHVAAADPVDHYLRLLRSALTSGRAHLAAPNGGAPWSGPGAWGWQPQGRSAAGEPEYQAQGDRIGWVDGDQVFLEPETAFGLAQRLATAQGQAIPVTARTLHKRLYQRDLLAQVETINGVTRFFVRPTLQGHRQRVLCIAAATLFPADTAPSAPTDGPGPAGPAEPGHTPTGECANSGPECANGRPAEPGVRHRNGRGNPRVGPAAAHSAHSRNGDAAQGSDGESSPWV